MDVNVRHTKTMPFKSSSLPAIYVVGDVFGLAKTSVTVPSVRRLRVLSTGESTQRDY